jgi:hypothetical protein
MTATISRRIIAAWLILLRTRCIFERNQISLSRFSDRFIRFVPDPKSTVAGSHRLLSNRCRGTMAARRVACALAVLLSSLAPALAGGGLGGAVGGAAGGVGGAVGSAGGAVGGAVGGVGGAVGGGLGGAVGGAGSAVGGAASGVGGAVGSAGAAVGGLAGSSGDSSSALGSTSGPSTSNASGAQSAPPGASSQPAPIAAGASPVTTWSSVPAAWPLVLPVQKQRLRRLPRLAVWLREGSRRGGFERAMAVNPRSSALVAVPSEAQIRVGLFNSTPQDVRQIRKLCSQILARPRIFDRPRVNACRIIRGLLG